MQDILVFQLARIGDLIQTKRLLLSIVAEPDTRVHLCVDHSLAALARLIFPFAVVHEITAHGGSGATPGKVGAQALETFSRLREIPFTRVYLPNYSPLAFACASLFPPETLRGYARVEGQDLKGPLANISFTLMSDRRFAPLNLVDLWGHLHFAPVAPEKVNPIPKPAGSNRIGVVMAGRESRRSLPPEVLAQCLVSIFQARKGPTFVMIGSASEQILVRKLARLLPPRMVERMEDLTGKTSLTDLVEVLSSLDMVLTPDTGAMHLAAHMGVPVQAFFLSSAWCYETGPYGFGHKVWQALSDCSPCLESAPCTKNLVCLAPFKQEAFLTHLKGKFAQDTTPGLLGCTSMLDDLGVTYKAVDGDDPYEQTRNELRKALLELFRRGAGDAPPFAMHPDVADFLFSEKSWMVPPDWNFSDFREWPNTDLM
ncbi:glycosyltransferase family 9 protein [Desulfovibrio sp. OttesenSCG-928-G15]|nr:glycosyltransferase family 9 protein [Desulfovibrio sp. OttesenSCG-928-G15]